MFSYAEKQEIHHDMGKNEGVSSSFGFCEGEVN
jgi:hypothetical protein